MLERIKELLLEFSGVAELTDETIDEYACRLYDIFTTDSSDWDYDDGGWDDYDWTDNDCYYDDEENSCGW